MASIVVRRVLERITRLDLMLTTRFARRTTERLARYLSRQSSQWSASDGSGRYETDNVRGACLGGLEVQYGSGSQVTMKAGAMAIPTASPVLETRPGTWGFTLENDDDDWGIYDLATATSVTPGTPISGALSQAEWWIYYVTASVANIETDSSSKVFNETTGVFDSASATKVSGHKLTPGVVRGAGGANLLAAFTSLPANSYMVAWAWVPVGATSLASAQFFDVRRLTSADKGPNTIQGHWRVPTTHFASPFSNQNGFIGEVRARHDNEWLECRTTLGSLIKQVVEPGADWGSSPPFSTPKVAWLYLCRVLGRVPRYKGTGDHAVGFGSLTNDRHIQAGALVYSPKPPRIDNGTGNARWDMRSSADIALPDITSGQVSYNYGGLTCGAGDAICVGFALYNDVDGATNTPIFLSEQYTDRAGWTTGEMIQQEGGGLFSATAHSTGAGNAVPVASVSLVTVPVGANTYAFPVDGVRSCLFGQLSAQNASVIWERSATYDIQYPIPDGGGAFRFARTQDSSAAFLGSTAPYDTHFGQVIGGTCSALGVSPIGVRLPYSEPLAT